MKKPKLKVSQTMSYDRLHRTVIPNNAGFPNNAAAAAVLAQGHPKATPPVGIATPPTTVTTTGSEKDKD
jgi:hypothetical protein